MNNLLDCSNMDLSGPCFDIMRRMIDLTKDESLRDLTLSVSGQEFKVHKFVMAASSQRLRQMITHMQSCDEEKGSGSVLIVDDVSPKGMRDLLFYIYSGKLPDLANEDDIEEFRRAAAVLEVSVHGLHDVSMTDVQHRVILPVTNEETNEDTAEIYIEVTTFPTDDTLSSDFINNALENTEEVASSLTPMERKSEVTSKDISDGQSFQASVKNEYLTFCTDNKSEVVVQIVGDNTSGSASDDDYNPDSINDDLLADQQNLTQQSESGPHRPSRNGAQRKFSEISSVKSEYIINGMDISKLFTTTKRNTSKSKTPPLVPDPSLALKRGRPRLPNDYLFPNKPPYICPHASCTKECDTREKLKKHYRSHEQRTHTCETCSKKFLYRKDLICHFRTHTGEKPFKCNVCGKGFSQKATLQYHAKMHDDARMEYFCEECGKHYKTFKGLQSHIEKFHGMDSSKFRTPDIGVLQNPFVCPVCSVRFRTDESMYHHMKRQHPDSEQIKQMPKIKNQRKPKEESRCSPTDIDNNLTNVSDDLKDHESSQEIEIGLGDVNSSSFFCMSCSLSFKHKDTFIKHIRKCDKDTIRLIFMCGFCKQCFESDEERSEHIAENHKKQSKCLTLDNSMVSAEVETDNLDPVRILNLENIF